MYIAVKVYLVDFLYISRELERGTWTNKLELFYLHFQCYTQIPYSP